MSRPGETRWNSLFDSLQQIYNSKEKLAELAKALGLKNCIFNNSEYKFMKEFLDCLRPLSEALDILQGEKHVYYGTILPCLLALQRKLQVSISL